MTTSVSPALDFNRFLPEGVTLYDYQQVGIAYALVTRRCFIADEMGLGKTWQALVALEASGLFNNGGTAVVVCPATLKGNWEREIRFLLPHRSVQVLGGKRPYETFGDILVINYDILSAWSEFLTADALVLDESHYCKEGKRQRTKAVSKIAASVKADGLVLALTGTAILNRPVELVEQLRILGKLEEVAPRPRKANPSERDWEFAFKFTFCGPERNDFGKFDFKGASNTDMLNERLRSSCYVRRLRKAVLDMNETRRITVPLALNGALDAYRAAESNLIGFIAKEKGVDAALRAKRAEVLVSLNTLRRLAGEAKAVATVEWVENFFASNEGRSLVVFAWHTEVQDALVAAFPGCSQILAGQKDVEAQKARFVAGETNLIVCSILAAKEGHTLVGPAIDCHDVLFVEQGWNPGVQQQAEDRVNRIGQDAEFVFAHYLLALDTLDEDLYELIEKKRVITTSVLDGNALEEGDDEEIQAEVLRRIVGRKLARG